MICGSMSALVRFFDNVETLFQRVHVVLGQAFDDSLSMTLTDLERLSTYVVVLRMSIGRKQIKDILVVDFEVGNAHLQVSILHFLENLMKASRYNSP